MPNRPSSSPSPVETDVAGSRPWADDDQTPTRKGKERAATANIHDESTALNSRMRSPSMSSDMGGRRADEDLLPTPKAGKGTMQIEDESDDEQAVDAAAYPPTTEQEAETRRVEETLRRWEIAERQRRKNARLSTTREGATHSPTSSLVSDVGRRASNFWSTAKAPGLSSRYPHHHTKLQSEDSLDVVRLEAVSPTPTSPNTPRTSTDHQNPFEIPTSPFSDSHQETAVMNPSSDISLPSTHPVPPGPPKPLGLPPPPIDVPPKANNTPRMDSSRREIEEEEPPKVRWWHEWLCGCGEGPDRGGHNQAGSTNPFE
ncbi:hypothetical protein CPB85DRAFT_1429441 [Mucidula mucida]|nr:hypothetical protein CPB85DRAFT_1429441 [Mucidula mucida]